MMALRADWRKNLSSRKQFLDVGDSVELVLVYAELFMNRWSDIGSHIKAITSQGTRSRAICLFDKCFHVDVRIVCYLPQKTVS